MKVYDIAIIGAGPAGMAASAEAAGLDASVLLLDDQPAPGGQIYRDVDRVAPLRGDMLGPDYLRGKSLTAGLAQPGIRYIRSAQVWMVNRDGTLAWSAGGKSAQARGRRVIIATGALERPVPVPGWTKPGVMVAGAGQILLKQSGLVAKDTVLVGSGPLLYLLASQMIRAGTPPLALVETQRQADFFAALPCLPAALRGYRYLLKGMKMLAEIRHAGVRRFVAATDIVIEGGEKAEALVFTSGERRRRIVCGKVLLHEGVVPNTQITRSLDIDHRWNARQNCFEPVVDEWGCTSVEAFYVAGDGAGIGGAVAAGLAGRLAVFGAACALGRVSADERDRRAAPLRAALSRQLAVRPFIDRAYPPSATTLLPADDTIVCRCEEATAGDIRRYARLGCLGPNQAKAFGRAGMGPCQGRYCGLTVTNILAEANGSTPEQTGYYRIRPPLKPIMIGELASFDDIERGLELET